MRDCQGRRWTRESEEKGKGAQHTGSFILHNPVSLEGVGGKGNWLGGAVGGPQGIDV